MPSNKVLVFAAGAAIVGGVAAWVIGRRKGEEEPPEACIEADATTKIIELTGGTKLFRAEPAAPRKEGAKDQSAAAPPPAKSPETAASTAVRVGEELKKTGNAALTSGRFADALEAYGEAIVTLDKELASSSKADVAMLNELKAACALNAAMASLKLMRFSEAVKWSDLALEVEPPKPGPGAVRSCKALFRRASARFEAGDADVAPAVRDLRLAVSLSPKADTAVLALLARAGVQLGRQRSLEGAWDEAQAAYRDADQAAGRAGGAAAEAGLEAQLGLAQMLFLGGDADLAGAAFLRAAERAPRDALVRVQALDGAVRCLMTQDKASEAVAAAEQLVGAVGEGAEGMSLGDALARLAGARTLEGEFRLKEGRFREADASYEAAESAAARLMQEEKSGGVLDPGSVGPAGPVGLRTDAMRMRGYCADALKDAAAAARHYTWALQLATESGDKTREAQVRLGLGASLFKAGEAGTAKAHLEAALALGRAVGDEAAVAAASGNLGKVLMAGGESAAAGERFREAFALREKHKDARGCAVQSINVGSAAALEEKDDEAEEWYRRALAFAQDAGARDTVAAALRSLVNHLGQVTYGTPEGEEAAAAARRKKKSGEAGALRAELDKTLQAMGFSGQGGECPVALEPFGARESVVVLECYHMVSHAAWDGLVQRLQANGEPLRCPLCRNEVVDPASRAARVAATM